MLSYNQNEISPDPGGLGFRYIIKSMMIVGLVLLGLQSIAEMFKNIKAVKK
jgi:TRAP-type mannitol/chloroaromatic compound transport system permease small subunit